MQIENKLSGKEIYLRTLVSLDATNQYLAWFKDHEVTQYLEIRFSLPGSIVELQSFIEAMLISDNNLLLGIFLKSNNCHIGNIKLGSLDWNHLTADVGILIGDKSKWGRGYAAAAITLIADYAFNCLNLAKLTAGFYENNVASIKSFKKAGFQYEGTRYSQWVFNETRQDGIILGIVNPQARANFSTL